MPQFVIYGLLCVAAATAGYTVVHRYNSAIEQAEVEREARKTAEQEAYQLRLDAIRNEYQTKQNQQEIQELARKYDEARQEGQQLETLIREHDLQRLYDAKPGLMLNRFNAGTQRVFDDIAEIVRANRERLGMSEPSGG